VLVPVLLAKQQGRVQFKSLLREPPPHQGGWNSCRRRRRRRRRHRHQVIRKRMVRDGSNKELKLLGF